MDKILIFMDIREINSGISRFFEQFECEVQQKMLLIGDFLVSDRVVIERKLTEDFVQSIVDKRLFDQLKRMKDNFEKPVLLIEGDTLYGRLHPNVIRGALSSIVLDMNIPIIWTKDMADTAGFVYWLAKREQVDERREISLHNKKNDVSTEQKQEYLVSALPDISTVRARALLGHFKTPNAIFKATEKQLREVEGIGPKTAKRVHELLSTKYNKR